MADEDDTYDEAEAKRRFEAAIRGARKPPKPQENVPRKERPAREKGKRRRGVDSER
jgi:hypothetical protein